MKAAFFLGRAIFGGFFLYNGITHIFLKRDALAQYAAAKGVLVRSKYSCGALIKLEQRYS